MINIYLFFVVLFTEKSPNVNRVGQLTKKFSGIGKSANGLHTDPSQNCFDWQVRNTQVYYCSWFICDSR